LKRWSQLPRQAVCILSTVLQRNIKHNDDCCGTRKYVGIISSTAAATSMPSQEQQPLLDKKELKEEDAKDSLAFSWSPSQKWTILSCIFVVQLSMNYNASVYGFAVKDIAAEFSVSETKARLGQALFLIAYGFGCELFAPWSESSLGRVLVMQISMTLVNAFTTMGIFAPNFATLIASRTLAGLSSAGGSVTLGMVADFEKPATHQYAVSFIVLASTLGSVVGGIAGPLLADHSGWRWNMGSQLIFGLIAQILHLLLVPETYPDVLMDREARRRRNSGQEKVYGPNEVGDGYSTKGVLKIIGRPYAMLATEPVVFFLSLLSGFSDALSFIFIESFPLVYKQFNLSEAALAYTFVPLALGYVIAFFAYFPSIKTQQKIRATEPDKLSPESRLKWLLYLVPLEPIGLAIFAWTSAPFLVGNRVLIPMASTILIAMANYTVYMTTVDYMIAAYGNHAASATGGNGWMRDVLSGLCALGATEFYTSIGDKYQYQWASTILAGLSLLVAIPAYIFYKYGHIYRERSAYA